MLLQVGVKYGGEDIPGSPFPMSSNPSLDDVTSGSPEKMRNNKNGEQNLYSISTFSFFIIVETALHLQLIREIMTFYL